MTEMYSRNLMNSAIAILLPTVLLLGACGSPPPRQPAAQERAQKTEQAAYRAIREGDMARAREMFALAETMQRALENIHAASQDAINLATVLHKMGNSDAALQKLDILLADSASLVPEDLKAAAAFRKAIIQTDGGKLEEANSSINRALSWCRADCPFNSGLKNLQARIALQQGQNDMALTLATAVYANSNFPEEQANAYRIAASAELALGKHEAAKTHFHEALRLDKELAISSRIADDLEGIASALQKLGNQKESNLYAQRAAEVRHAKKQLKDNPALKSLP